MSDQQTRKDGVTYYKHICQNVEGAIENIKSTRRKTIPWITDDAGQPMTRVAVLRELQRYKALGYRVIPMGTPCEGFDYQTGCPGHEQPD